MKWNHPLARKEQHAKPTATACPTSPDGDHYWVDLEAPMVRTVPLATVCSLCGTKQEPTSE